MKLCLLLIVFISFSLSASESAGVALASDVDILWVTISAALVFFMQAGFLMLESGLVRSKNTINVAIKNLVDYIAGSIGFFVVGFGLMFGSAGLFTGTDLFFLKNYNTPQEYTFFLFQIAFMGTAATIVSGAVAERIKFHSYMLMSVIISVLIYPIFGHWVWGGGWLAQLGFIDFAGSTVVHSVGGWIGLAGAIVLGPRKDKYSASGKLNHIYGHNLPLSVLGTLILWLGWFGFNGGSTLALTDSMPLIVVNTTLSACAGGTAALLLSWILNRFKRSGIEDIINGVVGGLVAVTAGCHLVNPAAALVIGSVSGLIVVVNVRLMDNVFKIDDVVGAFTVHALCGIWGTLCIPFLAANPTKGGSFVVQLIGVAVCAVWSFGLGLLFFYIFKMLKILRVSNEAEEMGLNIAEHGARTMWLDLMGAMNSVADNKGLPPAIDVELGTESGTIAAIFNKIMENLHQIVNSVSDNAVTVNAISGELSNTTAFISDTIATESSKLQQVSGFLDGIKAAFSKTNELAAELTSDTAKSSDLATLLHDRFVNLNKELHHSTKHTLDSHNFSVRGEEDLKNTVERMRQIESSSQKVTEVARFLVDISEQLTLLSLNASIEAARSGTEGQGFSIIAHEINNLSDTTLKHTKEAARYINEIGSTVSSGAAALSEAMDSFQTIRNEIDILKRIMKMLMEESDNYRSIVHEMRSFFSGINSKIDMITGMVRERDNDISEVFNALWGINQAFEELQSHSESVKGRSRDLYESSELMKQIVGSLSGNKECPING
ncbi:MAG TPA: ammonium transporter [Spirochaetota bacterium]|nr:ammonium transporter [Spirochaetota bacterium]